MSDGGPIPLSGEEAIRASFAAATPYQPPGTSEIPADWPFRRTPQGVEKRIDSTDKETGRVTSRWKWFCSSLDVIAETRNVQGQEWGRLLSITDRDGLTKHWAMPMALLAGDGSAYRERLFSLGLTIAPGNQARHYLHEYISSARPQEKARCVNRIGWHDGIFVLPDQVIGETAGERILLQSTSGSLDHAFRVRGSLEDWQATVGRLAVGNSRLVFALSAAFAAPLLDLIGAESGGFHLRGASSTGKSTALIVAGSVWGGGGVKGYLQQWRATDNGLETTAPAHCDALLCLDELSQVTPQAAGAAAYMLANGAGKVRAGRGGEMRPRAEWRCLFLSTGEISLGDKIAEDGRGRRAAAGQEVRVIDLPADAGAGLGLFECLHDLPGAEAFARAIKEAAQRHYGTAARAFLERITPRRGDVLDLLQAERDQFMAAVCLPGSDGQVMRVAARFGLIMAAGRLATALGITPWPPDQAIIAARRCFEDWLTQRGGTEPAEDREALARVQRFIEQHGSSRFEWIRLYGDNSDPGSERTINRAGFREIAADGSVHYYVLPEAWRHDVCAGIDPTRAAKVLQAAGLLITKGDKLQDVRRLPGFAKATRCYHLSGNILTGGADPDSDQNEPDHPVIRRLPHA